MPKAIDQKNKVQRTDGVLFACGTANAGDQTIVAADTANRKIRVVRYFLSAAIASTAVFKTSTGGVAISGVKNMAANGGAAGSEAAVFGHFETLPGDGLVLNTSAGSVGWDIDYTLES